MARRRRSSAKLLSEVLGGVVRDLGLEKRIREYDVVTRWSELVGNHIAHVATPTRILGGVLHVKVRTGTWRNELTMRKREIIEKVNKALGNNVLRDIRFR